MHCFSTSPSFRQGNSVNNLMWSQVQSNPQSYTINPGDQVNPMVKKEVSLNDITDTVREARANQWADTATTSAQPTSQHQTWHIEYLIRIKR